MPFVYEPRSSGCLGGHAFVQRRSWCSVRNVDVERDEEVHDVLLCVLLRGALACRR
jgi:hypothetical protein